jgi:hypothetical protein
VIGGRGADVLIGGPGQDTIYGDNDAGGCGPIICAIQEGSDTIRARDGERDTINCGVGFDIARRSTPSTSSRVASRSTLRQSAPAPARAVAASRVARP